MFPRMCRCQQNAFLITLILICAVTLEGQSTRAQSKSLASRRSNTVQPKYLSTPLDLTSTNLGQGFRGHDITAVVGAIKKSPALRGKSEFESTSAFEVRKAGFVKQVLYAGLVPSGYFGFVIDGGSIFPPEFKYDADSESIAVTLTGSTEQFVLDDDKPTLDGIVIRDIVKERKNYTASNAFGAKVQVRSTFSDVYGIAFDQDNWLFRAAEDYSRRFTYNLPMPPSEARSWKIDGKLLLVCRLSEPWLRHSAHGHDPTIDEPYETLVDDNYLQVVPDQLWIFNEKTGGVIRKLSASTIATEQDRQMNLNVSQFPLLLDVSPSRMLSYKIAVDDQLEESGLLSIRSKTFAARRKIVFTIIYPRDLSEISFKLNGKPYTPSWTKNGSTIGGIESITSATAVVELP